MRRDGRPRTAEPASISTAKTISRPTVSHGGTYAQQPQPVDSYLDHFIMRLLTEAIETQTRRFWLKRAQDFLNARPRPDEYHGRKTPEQLRETWQRLTDIANACRARANVAPLEEIDPDVRNVWDEVAS